MLHLPVWKDNPAIMFDRFELVLVCSVFIFKDTTPGPRKQTSAGQGLMGGEGEGVESGRCKLLQHFGRDQWQFGREQQQFSRERRGFSLLVKLRL